MNRVQIKFIKDALDHEDHLTDWESQFINDLAVKPDDYELSDKQNAVLNRISDKVNRI